MGQLIAIRSPEQEAQLALDTTRFLKHQPVREVLVTARQVLAAFGSICGGNPEYDAVFEAAKRLIISLETERMEALGCLVFCEGRERNDPEYIRTMYNAKRYLKREVVVPVPVPR